MRFVLRCGLITLILLGLASQVVRASRGYNGADGVAELRGNLERMNIRLHETSTVGLMRGHAPSCETPLYIARMAIDGSDDDKIWNISRSDFTIKYVLGGSVSDRRSTASLIGDWVWNAALFQTGFRSTQPSQYMVMVALPRGCPVLAALNWSELSR